MAGKFYIVSIGPGDADLITLRAIDAIKQASLVICNEGIGKTFGQYLEGKELLELWGKMWEDFEKISIEERLLRFKQMGEKRREALKRIKERLGEGKDVALLVRGDPCIFSPTKWFINQLGDERVVIVPGVGSLGAAAAALKRSLVAGEHTRSVIITVPDNLAEDYGLDNEPRLDDIESLAKPQTTLVFFMGLMKLEGLVKRLTQYYSLDTPVAVVYKAGHKVQEKIIQGTLKDIAAKTKAEEERFLGLILVGQFLKHEQQSLWDRIEQHAQKASQVHNPDYS